MGRTAPARRGRRCIPRETIGETEGVEETAVESPWSRDPTYADVYLLHY